MEDHTFEIDASKFSGVKNNFVLAVTNADNVFIDAWQFTKAGATGINEVNNEQATRTQTYDLLGRRLSDSNNHHGIVIEQYQDANGHKYNRKHMR
jgi:hypothetical protein